MFEEEDPFQESAQESHSHISESDVSNAETFSHNLSEESNEKEKVGNLVQLKGQIKQAQIELDKKTYKTKLVKHVKRLEHQLSPANAENPFKFKYAYAEFRTFLVNHWHEADYDIDNKTKKQIEHVLNIETSATFNTYQYVASNTDYFMRFAYLNFFGYYSLLQFGFLFDNPDLYTAGSVFMLISWVLYIGYHIKETKRLKRCTLKEAVFHYLKFTPCMPKRADRKSVV